MVYGVWLGRRYGLTAGQTLTDLLTRLVDHHGDRIVRPAEGRPGLRPG